MNQDSLNLQTKATGPVECLGQRFPNDEARREYYLKLLAEKLKDPEFRKIEGFPIGKDEEILALSDPPYYTACPNPWLGEFIKCYGTPYNAKTPYHREPFVADVTEGKNHPVYSGHPYHTKVPHRAIMRYLLHYTHPGNLVFDGFCGTGMTGVAAQLCADQQEVEALGFRVSKDGSVIASDGKVFSSLGPRRAVLNDLSPIATFVSWNYNSPIDGTDFNKAGHNLIQSLENQCSWMFVTLHQCSPKLRKAACEAVARCSTRAALQHLLSTPASLAKDIGASADDIKFGYIHYAIYTDIFTCPECGSSVNYWDAAVTAGAQGIRDNFKCPSCSVSLTRDALQRSWDNHFDIKLNQVLRQKKDELVSVSYSFGSQRFEFPATDFDRTLHDALQRVIGEFDFPVLRMPDGEESRRNDDIGITHIHHFYTPRNLATFSIAFAEAKKCQELQLALTGSLISASRMYRWTPNYEGGGPLSGTLYMPALTRDISALDAIARFLKKLPKVHHELRERQANCFALGTASMSSLTDLPCESVDYIFLDPPFGANINYSELSFLWEAWLGVTTENTNEAIQNKIQRKGLAEYHKLITDCLRSAHRVLKPGRWITIEFSNTKASVWNAIQTALQEVGFVVANVSTLDKVSKTFKAINSPTAVKQDLVISAYKPNGGLEERFARRGETEEGVWDFIRTHLKNLPIIKLRGGQLEIITERDPRILYDRMVAFYVGHSTPVPLSSAEFQAGLAEKFPERDGMYFLPEQVNEYDKKRPQIENMGQLTIFVEDERSAINWLRNVLKSRPSTYQDIQPEFMQQLGASWKKWEARPELSALLDQNFLCYDGQTGEVPSQVHSYLSTQFKELRNLAKDHPQLKAKAKNRWYVPDPKKNVDVETIRNRRLLAEFWTYLPAGYSPPALTADKGQILPGLTVARPKVPKGKKLKELRTEAVRVGFKHCYQQKDYITILVVAEMLPESVLNEDEQLQMIYDTAVTRTGGE